MTESIQYPEQIDSEDARGEAPSIGSGQTYMMDSCHYSQLVSNLVFENTILDELSLVEFFGSKCFAIVLSGDHVHSGKSTSANRFHDVVLITAFPIYVPHTSASI